MNKSQTATIACWIRAVLKNFSLGIFLGFFLVQQASAITPRSKGLGEAGLAAANGDALFLNPASVSLMKKNMVFGSYVKSSIEPLDPGGHAYVGGIYDGKNKYARAGAAYIRESRRVLITSEETDYIDKTQYRIVLGRKIFSWMHGGVRVMHTDRNEDGKESSYVHGDLAAWMPILGRLTAGAEYRNVINQEGEDPPEIRLGLGYETESSFNFYADAGFLQDGAKKGEKSWAVAMVVKFMGSFKLRGGLYKNSLREQKGYSLGVSWDGPRTSFEYSLNSGNADVRQREHVFGIRVEI